MKQNVFIDDASSDSSCGWLLDDSSSCGIHVMKSYLPYFFVVVPKSLFPIQLILKSLRIHHPICWILLTQIGWLLIDNIVDWTFGDQDSCVAPVLRSQFRAIVVTFLVLFSDVRFSYYSKKICLVCFFTWRSDMMSRKQVWECVVCFSKIYSCSNSIQLYYNYSILIIHQWQQELVAVISLKEQCRRQLNAMSKMISGVLHWQCVHYKRKRSLGSYVVDCCVLPPMLTKLSISS